MQRLAVGAEKMARFMAGGLAKADVTLTVDPTVVNGNPALVMRVDGDFDGAIAIRVEDDRITSLYSPQPREADPHRIRDPLTHHTGYPQ